MKKKVLDVGQCDIDNWQISQMLKKHFDVQVERARTHRDAIAAMQQESFDLVLVNRINDADGSEGLDLVKQIRGESQYSETAVMIVSNFAEAQQAAVECGAAYGFGKSELNERQVLDRLGNALESTNP